MLELLAQLTPYLEPAVASFAGSPSHSSQVVLKWDDEGASSEPSRGSWQAGVAWAYLDANVMPETSPVAAVVE